MLLRNHPAPRIQWFFHTLFRLYFYYYAAFMVLLTLDFIPDQLMSLINLGSLAVGALLTVYVWVTDRPFDRRNPMFPIFIVLCLFFLSFLVTVLINRKDNLVSNVKAIAANGIQIFVLFYYLASTGAGNAKKAFEQIMYAFIFLAFAVAAVNVTLFVGHIHLRESEPRFMGLFSNPNNSSVSVLALICSLYMLRMNATMKWFHVLNMVFQLIVVILCNSRACSLMLAAVVVLFSVAYAWEKKNNLKSRVLMAVALIALAVAVYAAMTWLVHAYSLISLGGSGLTEPDDSIDKELSSAARLGILKSGLGVFVNNPIFGVGPRNVAMRTIMAYPLVNLHGIEKGGLHNAYLHILAANGSVGFLLLAALAVICIRRMLPVRNHEIYYAISILVGLCVLALFEINPFLVNFPTSMILWSALGYAVNRSSEPVRTDEMVSA